METEAFLLRQLFSSTTPIDYSARAKVRCTLFALKRKEMRDVLSEYSADLPAVLKAIKHAMSINRGKRTNLQPAGKCRSEVSA